MRKSGGGRANRRRVMREKHGSVRDGWFEGLESVCSRVKGGLVEVWDGVQGSRSASFIP